MLQSEINSLAPTKATPPLCQKVENFLIEKNPSKDSNY